MKALWRFLFTLCLLPWMTTNLSAQEIISESMQLRESGTRESKLYLRYPKSGKEKVQGLILFCKYGDKDLMADLTGGSKHAWHLLEFADQFNYALVGFGQPTQQGWNKTVSADQLKGREANAQNRKLDAIAREWSRYMTRYAQKHKLPQSDWLLYGICGGAQYAHRIALREPQLFKAVHVHYGGSYDIPTDEAKSVRWLVTSFVDEPAYIAAQRFCKSCREKDYPIILKGFSQRKKPGETNPVNIYGRSSPLQHLSTEFFKFAISKGGETDEKFLADYVNGVVLPYEKASWLPKSQTVLLPTRTLAEAWGKITE